MKISRISSASTEKRKPAESDIYLCGAASATPTRAPSLAGLFGMLGWRISVIPDGQWIARSVTAKNVFPRHLDPEDRMLTQAIEVRPVDVHRQNDPPMKI